MKKVAFIFPGQGSQGIGMGKSFYENSELARDLIDKASETAKIDFKKLMFEENQDLSKTEFTQPAILLVGLVAFELFKKEIAIKPEFLLGHSLGEFTALSATGALDIFDAVKLVNKRGELMQKACENINAGMMAVIGLADEVILNVLENEQKNGKKVWGANFNSNGQVVVAGIKSDLEALQPILKEAGAKKSVVLDMSVASHCELLKSAEDELKSELEKNVKDSFIAPIISNVTAREYQSKTEAVELLTKQLTSPVKYRESIEYISDKIDLFIEFGHSTVLKGLNRRIARKIPTLNISDMVTLEKTVQELNK
jgi:[acyl-carrier-protein] S-malonyltransferase